MSHLEALAMVIAEQKDYIVQLEKDADFLSNRAKMFESHFEMSKATCNEYVNANRELREEIRYLTGELSALIDARERDNDGDHHLDENRSVTNQG